VRSRAAFVLVDAAIWIGVAVAALAFGGRRRQPGADATARRQVPRDRLV
jgi:hypothetical protein